MSVLVHSISSLGLDKVTRSIYVQWGCVLSDHAVRSPCCHCGNYNLFTRPSDNANWRLIQRHTVIMAWRFLSQLFRCVDSGCAQAYQFYLPFSAFGRMRDFDARSSTNQRIQTVSNLGRGSFYWQTCYVILPRQVCRTLYLRQGIVLSTAIFVCFSKAKLPIVFPLDVHPSACVDRLADLISWHSVCCVHVDNIIRYCIW